MIENPKILTGSPENVEKQLSEYLAAHPAPSSYPVIHVFHPQLARSWEAVLFH